MEIAAEALNGVVVEVEMSQLNVLSLEGIQIDAEAVVLAGDFNSAGLEVLDGVVCTVVAELELVGFGAECKGEELMAETDAEDGQSAEELFDSFNGVSDGGGVCSFESFVRERRIRGQAGRGKPWSSRERPQGRFGGLSWRLPPAEAPGEHMHSHRSHHPGTWLRFERFPLIPPNPAAHPLCSAG